MMRHIRKVAEGKIEAPALARQDAAAAIAAHNLGARAETLWDGTVEDVAGYMRMIAASASSGMAIRETMGPGISRIVPGAVMFDFFLESSDNQAYNRMDPSVREVATACASIHLGLNLGPATEREEIELQAAVLKSACELLGHDEEEVTRRQMECHNLEGKNMEHADLINMMWHHGDEKLESLQQALYDVLGLTTADINLVELRYFCRWRFACVLLGSEKASNPLKDEQLDKFGVLLLDTCIAEKPHFLPPYYDLAMHLSSDPVQQFQGGIKVTAGHDALDVCQMGFAAAREKRGGAWAELRLTCMAAAAVMAGALTVPRTQEPRLSMIYFTAAQLRPYVEAAEVLLERMRPWLSESPGFKNAEKEVVEWRKEFLSGNDENSPWMPRAMSGKSSHYAGILPGAGGSGSGSGRACATCGAISDTLKLCTACRQVRYCNSKCQKADWKAHKKACVASRKNA